MNPDHMEIVRRGNQAIDAWRHAHPDERLDLSEANLSGAVVIGIGLNSTRLGRPDLSGMNLRYTRLFRANLKWAPVANADLTGADLTMADLTQADLSRTKLVGAGLEGANLTRTNLSGADLSGVVLFYTIFHATVLHGVNFFGAIFGDTVIADCDLSLAQGLEQVEHQSPSTIGVDTIMRSHGQIPEGFLRGAAVPDPIIRFAQSLR